jgi:hypothetical protein
MPRLPDTRPQVHATTDTPVHYGRPACIAQVHTVSGGRSIRRPPRLVTTVSALPQGRLRAAAMSAGGHHGGVTAVSVGTRTGGHCRSRPVDCTGTRPQPVADTTARQGDRRGHAADTTVVRAPAAEVPTGLCGSNAVRSAALVKGPARSAAVLWGGVPDSTEHSDLSQNSLPPALAVTYDLVAVHQLIHEDESYRAPASDAWHPGPEAGCRR